jgi:puromycin-sensitive aminopeptidase
MVDDYARALGDDALANTHAIEVKVEDPRAVEEVFDAISYSKGASIIHMLHNYLGAETFQDGLHLYLTRHQYGNAVTADLWSALGEASGVPVAEMMSGWTNQPGYPILEFKDGQVRQQRFYASPREAAKAQRRQERTGQAPQLWRVPLTILTAGGETIRLVLTDEVTELPESVTAAAWFKPNAGQAGFYRTLYTAEMIESLTEPLVQEALVEDDRFGVVSDQFAATKAGLASSATALELLGAMRQEPDYIVWDELTTGLISLLAVTEDEQLRRQLEQFGHWFVEPAVQRLGWSPRPIDSSLDALMRPMALQLAVRFEDRATVAEAKRRFATYLETGELDPDLRGVVFFAIARNGSATDFDILQDLYRKELIPQVRLDLLRVLSHFRQPELVQRSLNYALSDEVRAQDTVYPIAYGLLGRDSRELAWKFVQDHWATLLERYGDGGHTLSRFPLYAGMGLADRRKAREIKKFFAANPHPSITRSVKQAVESVTLKADWSQRDHDAVAHFLDGWEDTSQAA